MPKIEQNVVLLRYTPAPDEIAAMGARICYSPMDIAALEEKVEGASQEKFLRGVMESGHHSLLEHASFTFGIEGVSRALLAQITRHRIASFSVQSQRYVKAEEDFDYVVPDAILALGEEEVSIYREQMKAIGEYYAYWTEKLGGKGESSNEDARFVLPQAAATRMILTMNARELLHFFSLRCCERAQWEIRKLAWRMFALVYAVAPTIFEQAGPGCVNSVCPEGKRSCGKTREIREKQAEIRRKAVEQDA